MTTSEYMGKKIVVFHPDIYAHTTNNEYTKKMYSLLEQSYEVRSFEWFIKHPFDKNIHALYLNWFENTLGKKVVIIQRLQYLFKLITLKWARLRKIKVCYVVHNKTPHNVSRESSIYKFASRRFMKKALAVSDTIVELCKHTEEYLSEEYEFSNSKEKIVFVPHGKYTKYECDPFRYREKYGISKDELLFSFVGKMDKYKNIDLIIKAFYQADIKGKLLLVGKINDEYEKEIKELITDERVIVDFSYVSDKDMSGIMQAANAIVLPYENTSMNSGILINAFSNGTTVVGTEIEMMQDFPNDLVYGYTHNGKDHVEALAQALKYAQIDFNNEDLNNKGIELQAIVEENNNWEVVKEKLLYAVR